MRHFVTHVRKRIAERLITELADVIVPGGRLLLLAVHVRLSTEATGVLFGPLVDAPISSSSDVITTTDVNRWGEKVKEIVPFSDSLAF